ncbi:hypothetical protein Vretimale_6077, partial [Volvox reticuliferus]
HDVLHSLDSPPGAGTQVPYNDGVDGGGADGGGDMPPLMAHVDDADSGAAAGSGRGCAGDTAAASTPTSHEYDDQAVHTPGMACEGAGGGDAERQGSNMAAPERWLDAGAAAAAAASPTDASAAQATVMMMQEGGGEGRAFGIDG